MSKFITVRFEVSDDTDKETFIEQLTKAVHEDTRELDQISQSIIDVQDNDNPIE